MIDRALAVVSLVPFVIGATSGPEDPTYSVDVTYQDQAIVEASGLVVRDGFFVTVNDSGDGGRIFTVDGSGRTVGTTSWADDPIDTEALAPAGDGEVWVGDIGDNPGVRSSIAVLKVSYGPGDRAVTPESYELVYPDGAHDAETLLAQPRTGQLFVVTKDVFGGTMYAAPRELSADGPNELTAVVDTSGFVTDGSFFPDGHSYVLRDYGNAAIYSFPDHERLASFRLPSQQQGEGISVAEDGSVHLNTEGQFSDVLQANTVTAWAAATDALRFVGRVVGLLLGHGAAA